MTPLLLPLRRFAGKEVLLALSGGADSVGLLRALQEVGATVTVAHFDHRLRPDSGDDAAWVEALCKEFRLALALGGADVAGVARARGWTVEQAARTLRYTFLAQTARQRTLNTILTAHTRGDQAETVLHQLLRGEHALTGIAPVSGHLVRPWLNVERSDIEAYLCQLGQGWREDASNLDRAFTRNWLRHDVLPNLRSRFPSLHAVLARLAAWQAEDEALLGALASSVPPHASLERESPAVLRRLVAQQLRGARLDFHADHVERLSGALREGNTRHVTLPGGRDVTVTGGALHLTSVEWPIPDFAFPASWERRHRRPGDRIRLGGGTRKLSDLLSDRKVPRAERDRIWLLCEGERVQWIGLRPPVWASDSDAEFRPAGLGGGEAPWWTEMGEALGLAAQAAVAGEVPVGALVVYHGQVIASARNTSRQDGDMTRHAELLALQRASQILRTPYLNDCTLVVTLEPCLMCYGAAVESRIGEIVFGADNPKLGALGGLSDVSRAPWSHRPRITRGVRAREASALLHSFFLDRRQNPQES